MSTPAQRHSETTVSTNKKKLPSRATAARTTMPRNTATSGMLHQPFAQIQTASFLEPLLLLSERRAKCGSGGLTAVLPTAIPTEFWVDDCLPVHSSRDGSTFDEESNKFVENLFPSEVPSGRREVYQLAATLDRLMHSYNSVQDETSASSALRRGTTDAATAASHAGCNEQLLPHPCDDAYVKERKHVVSTLLAGLHEISRQCSAHMAEQGLLLSCLVSSLSSVLNSSFLDVELLRERVSEIEAFDVKGTVATLTDEIVQRDVALGAARGDILALQAKVECAAQYEVEIQKFRDREALLAEFAQRQSARNAELLQFRLPEALAEPHSKAGFSGLPIFSSSGLFDSYPAGVMGRGEAERLRESFGSTQPPQQQQQPQSQNPVRRTSDLGGVEYIDAIVQVSMDEKENDDIFANAHCFLDNLQRTVEHSEAVCREAYSAAALRGNPSPHVSAAMIKLSEVKSKSLEDNMKRAPVMSQQSKKERGLYVVPRKTVADLFRLASHALGELSLRLSALSSASEIKSKNILRAPTLRSQPCPLCQRVGEDLLHKAHLAEEIEILKMKLSAGEEEMLTVQTRERQLRSELDRLRRSSINLETHIAKMEHSVISASLLRRSVNASTQTTASAVGGAPLAPPPHVLHRSGSRRQSLPMVGAAELGPSRDSARRPSGVSETDTTVTTADKSTPLSGSFAPASKRTFAPWATPDGTTKPQRRQSLGSNSWRQSAAPPSQPSPSHTMPKGLSRRGSLGATPVQKSASRPLPDKPNSVKPIEWLLGTVKDFYRFKSSKDAVSSHDSSAEKSVEELFAEFLDTREMEGSSRVPTADLRRDVAMACDAYAADARVLAFAWFLSKHYDAEAFRWFCRFDKAIDNALCLFGLEQPTEEVTDFECPLECVAHAIAWVFGDTLPGHAFAGLALSLSTASLEENKALVRATRRRSVAAAFSFLSLSEDAENRIVRRGAFSIPFCDLLQTKIGEVEALSTGTVVRQRQATPDLQQ